MAAPAWRRGLAERQPALELDPAEHRVQFRGKPVELSAREFSLLHELMRNAGRVLSRDRLIELTRAEIPYRTAVVVERFVEEKDRCVVGAAIHVEKESQKGIVIGRAGKNLTRDTALEHVLGVGGDDFVLVEGEEPLELLPGNSDSGRIALLLGEGCRREAEENRDNPDNLGEMS